MSVFVCCVVVNVFTTIVQETVGHLSLIHQYQAPYHHYRKHKGSSVKLQVLIMYD